MSGLMITMQNKMPSLVQGDMPLNEYRLKADYSFGDIVKEILNIKDN